MKIPRFIEREKNGFYTTLRRRVDEYFTNRNLSKNANGFMVFKTILFWGGYIGLYLLILLGGFSLWTSFGLALVMGFFGAMVGFNVSHDAIHGSYSSRKWLNNLISFSFDTLGASPYIWRISHNVVHHTYTNIPGHDEDIEVAPGLVRLSPEDNLNSVQRYQHLYAFFLYGFTSFMWVLKKDYKKFFQKNIGNYVHKHTTANYVRLFASKAVYYFLFIALPLMIMPINFWQWLLGFFCMHFVEGLTLGLVFQLAHVVEDTAFPTPNENGDIEESWAIHQMYTTANFARKSWLAGFLCGGLNMQVEHHLFPTVCHIHYRAISEIVKATAEEFNVPYLENKTFLGALGSHYRMLQKFGAEAWELRHAPILEEVEMH
jgi:linoleoyl-CoA desaturase